MEHNFCILSQFSYAPVATCVLLQFELVPLHPHMINIFGNVRTSSITWCYSGYAPCCEILNELVFFAFSWNIFDNIMDAAAFKFIWSFLHSPEHFLIKLCCFMQVQSFYLSLAPLGVPSSTKSAVFFNIVQKGGGVKPMLKKFVAKFVWFERPFGNIKLT